MELPIIPACDTTKNWNKSDTVLGKNEFAIEIAEGAGGRAERHLLIGDGRPAGPNVERLRAGPEIIADLPRRLANGIQALASGFFGVQVDEQGNLYALLADGATNPLRYDADTGGLYYQVGDKEFFVGNARGDTGATGETGATGLNGLQALSSGFFGVQVDEQGNLYALLADGAVNPLRYDADTGGLYYQVGDNEFFVGNVKGPKGDPLNRTITIIDSTENTDSYYKADDTGEDIHLAVGVHIYDEEEAHDLPTPEGILKLSEWLRSARRSLKYLFNHKQNQLDRTVSTDDSSSNSGTYDEGINIAIPVPVTTGTPVASSTQTTAGTRSLRAQIKIIIDNIAYLFTNKANLESPALTGIPTAPTAATSANNAQIATTAFAQSLVAEAQLTTQTWLPAVRAKADLRTSAILAGQATLANTINYLCRVISDGAASNNGVWQLLAGSWAANPALANWTYFSDNADWVDDAELAAAIGSHNADASAHDARFAAKQNSLNRTVVTSAESSSANAADTGGNLTIPLPVAVDAPAASSAQITAATRTLKATLKILIDNIASIFASLGGKEPAIAAGTAAQYWRGDKTWQTLPTIAGPAGAEGLGVFTTTDSINVSVGTTLPGVPIVAITGRTIKIGDIVISTTSPYRWGRVTAVASQTSATIILLGTLKGSDGETSAAGARGKSPISDMYAYYPLDGIEGSQLLDGSGNGRHLYKGGTVIGSPTTDPVMAERGIADVMRFQGNANSFASLQSEYFDTRTSFTIAVWVKAASSRNSQQYLAGSAESAGFYLAVDANNEVKFGLYSASAYHIAVTESNKIPLNAWTHVIAKFDSKKLTLEIKINNVKEAEYAMPSIGTISSAPFTLGANPPGGLDAAAGFGSTFNGFLSSCCVLMRASNETEDLAMFASQLINAPARPSQTFNISSTTTTVAQLRANTKDARIGDRLLVIGTANVTVAGASRTPGTLLTIAEIPMNVSNGAIAVTADADLRGPANFDTALPAMDGAAAAGTAATVPRRDHVHPSDTSRLPLSGGDMTGSIRGFSNAGVQWIESTGKTNNSAAFIRKKPPAGTGASSVLAWIDPSGNGWGLGNGLTKENSNNNLLAFHTAAQLEAGANVAPKTVIGTNENGEISSLALTAAMKDALNVGTIVGLRLAANGDLYYTKQIS